RGRGPHGRRAAVPALERSPGRAARVLLRHGRLPGLPGDDRRRAQRARVHDSRATRHAHRDPARARRRERDAMTATPRTVDCVIVGGGPAGLAAARTAARAGVAVMLVDENADLGGQYYRRLPNACGAAARSHRGREAAEGERLIEEVRELGVELCLGAVAWGIFDERTVAVATAERTTLITARTLILAPGAYDRPVPFPGWTLPGVFTAGGAQNLMKGYGVLPGRRVLIAGSGPLLLAL